MLDDWTALHMKEWIEAHVAEDSQDVAINAMLAFLDDYPDLIGTRSWTEIHALAMRAAADRRRKHDDSRIVSRQIPCVSGRTDATPAAKAESEAMTPDRIPERRILCLLCNGRCDPEKWTCYKCHDRLMRLAAERLIDDALREQVERERAEAAQEATCTP